MHIKLKHNGGNKTDREQLAVLMTLSQEAICLAELKGEPRPKMIFNLPNGFLDVQFTAFLGIQKILPGEARERRGGQLAGAEEAAVAQVRPCGLLMITTILADVRVGRYDERA